MNQKFVREEFDLYVWEGTSDIAARAERCLAGMDVTLVRADAGTAFPPPRDPGRPAVALVSVSVMGDNRFSGYDWLAVQALPIIWVASEARGRDPRYYPPEYSYTLPLAFTTADLRKLLFELLGVLGQARPAAPRREQPLIAVSEPMRALLAEAEMYADCRSNVLVHGETGVGKERVARLLHDRAAWADGPFVAVNCGAIPEGLFEAHFSATPRGVHRRRRRAQGLFRAGQWRHAVPGRDRRPAVVPAGQAVAGAGAEHGHAPGLGERSAGGFPAGRRHQQGSASAGGAGRVPRGSVLPAGGDRIAHPQPGAARGRREGRAVPLLLERMGAGDEPPDWLLERVGATRYEGNVRELSNVAERVAIVRRQFQSWDRARIERIFDQLAEPLRPPAAMGAGGAQCEPPVFTDAERAERARILAALDANGWRRQDTANTLGISRKVLWEKMRKLHLGGGQGETADGMVEAS